MRPSPPLLALLTLGLALPALSGGIPIDETKALGVIQCYGVPTDALRQGQWQLRVSPGLILNKDKSEQADQIDLHGPGAAASLVYAFTDHWGLMALAGGGTMTGQAGVDPYPNPPAELQSTVNQMFGGAAVEGDATSRGIVASAGAVWDHWTGDGFRLPVMLGVSYLDVSETAKSATLENTGTTRSPGVFVGLAPQFPVWRLRVAPYAAWTDSFEPSRNTLTQYDQGGGVVRSVSYDAPGNGDSRQTHSGGVAVEYMPWGLAGNFLFPLEGISAFTLTWSKKFP